MLRAPPTRALGSPRTPCRTPDDRPPPAVSPPPQFEDGERISRLQRTLSCKKVWEFDKSTARRIVCLDFDETLVQFARTSLARHAEVVMTCCRAGAGGPGTVRIDGSEADTRCRLPSC